MAQALPFIYLGATVLSGALAYRQQRTAGKIAEFQYRDQAEQEETAARDREIERRRRLVQALASQNAEAGALGIDGATGSRRAIVLDDVRRSRMDSLSDRAMTNRRAVNLRSAGGNYRRQSNIGAATNLLDTVSSVAQAG